MEMARSVKLWMVLVAGAVVAATLVVGITLDAGVARAATPTRATVEATHFTVPDGQVGEAFALCPGTKRAVGGGVVQSGPASTGMKVLASGPLDSTGTTLETNDGDKAKQWYAAVRNASGSDRTYGVFALCSGSSDATIEATPLTSEGGFNEAAAVCPGKKRALGGGVVQSGPPANTLEVLASGPLDSTGITTQTNTGDKAKQWYAAINNATGEVRSIKVFAICSGTSSATIQAATLNIGGRQTGEAEVVCPGGKRALGGGVVQSGPPNDFLLKASGPLDATGTTLETNDGDKATEWYAAILNVNSTPRVAKVFAICE